MRFSRLASFIDHITAWRIPWAEVLVIHRNETIFHYRNGLLDLEQQLPIREEQVVNIYSLSKIMTCVSALRLVEQGRIHLNDPLADYMPEFAEMNVLHRRADGTSELVRAERPITVRDLFTMSAGFSYNLGAPAIQEANRQSNGALSTRNFAKALAKEPLGFEPGTRWNYSLCHDVLAALVEAVDGRTIGNYVRDEITGPLGMRNTGFQPTLELQNRLAPQYRFDDELGRAVRQDGNRYRFSTAYESGGAGLLSTVSDYALFLNALTNRGTSPDGVRILSPATVDLMRTDHLSGTMRENLNWKQLKGYSYGLGVRTHVSKAESGSLSSLGEFGWSGAAGGLAVIDPELGLTIMYAQHLLNNQEPFVHPRLRNIVYGCL